MITKTIKLYEYSELSETAKETIRDKWRSHDVMEGYNSDYIATMNAFEKLCDIKICRWEVSDWNHRFDIDYGCTGVYEYPDKDELWNWVYLDDLKGKHLFRYVSTNIIPYIVKRKELWKNYPKKFVSRVNYETEPEKGTCPLTGVCMDCDIIEPLMKYYRNWARDYNDDYTFADLMEECVESFFKAWQSEWEYRMSDESIDEDIEANTTWMSGKELVTQMYFADGTEYNGELDEVAEKGAA